MTTSCPPLLILIAGPYRSNTGDDPAKIAANLRLMNDCALDVYRLGHLPVTGESLALPLIERAGSQRIGDEIFNNLFHPFAHRLAAKVDGILRVGGASKGADEMMELGRAQGKRLFKQLSEIPVATSPDVAVR